MLQCDVQNQTELSNILLKDTDITVSWGRKGDGIAEVYQDF